MAPRLAERAVARARNVTEHSVEARAAGQVREVLRLVVRDHQRGAWESAHRVHEHPAALEVVVVRDQQPARPDLVGELAALAARRGAHVHDALAGLRAEQGDREH